MYPISAFFSVFFVSYFCCKSKIVTKATCIASLCFFLLYFINEITRYHCLVFTRHYVQVKQQNDNVFLKKTESKTISDQLKTDCFVNLIGNWILDFGN